MAFGPTLKEVPEENEVLIARRRATDSDKCSQGYGLGAFFIHGRYGDTCKPDVVESYHNNSRGNVDGLGLCFFEAAAKLLSSKGVDHSQISASASQS